MATRKKPTWWKFVKDTYKVFRSVPNIHLWGYGLCGEKNIRYVYVEIGLLIHWGSPWLPMFTVSLLENLDYTFL